MFKQKEIRIASEYDEPSGNRKASRNTQPKILTFKMSDGRVFTKNKEVKIYRK